MGLIVKELIPGLPSYLYSTNDPREIDKILRNHLAKGIPFYFWKSPGINENESFGAFCPDLGLEASNVDELFIAYGTLFTPLVSVHDGAERENIRRKANMLIGKIEDLQRCSPAN